MTELEYAIKHIKTRADAWAVKEVTDALRSISERLEKALSQEQTIEHDPCETCGYAEGSPFCLQYCPYDAERKKEQEPCEDAEQIDYYDDFVTALKKISDYKRIKDMTDEEVYKRFVEPHQESEE